jgi:hypothetical protein
MGVAGIRGGTLLRVGGRIMLFECGQEKSSEGERVGRGSGRCFSFVLCL